jgi:hypothetical protein
VLISELIGDRFRRVVEGGDDLMGPEMKWYEFDKWSFNESTE